MQKPLASMLFDVEGTLVDCVPGILDSWREILEAAGYSVALAQLQRYSGMDGADMLDRLLPSAPDFEKKRLLDGRILARGAHT